MYTVLYTIHNVNELTKEQKDNGKNARETKSPKTRSHKSLEI